MTPGAHLYWPESLLHITLQIILVYLSHMMTTTANYISTMISKISFTPSPSHQRNSSVRRDNISPRFYFIRGHFGCPKQAYCCRHLAMLLKPLHFCQAFTAFKRDYKPSNLQPFDSDSFQIKTDNCASKCITNSLGDFQTL